MQASLIRREHSPCLVPVVVLTPRGEFARLVDEDLRGDAWADQDGRDLRGVDHPGLIELLKADVGIGILQVQGEVLVLEDGAEHTRDVYERNEVGACDKHYGRCEPEKQARDVFTLSGRRIRPGRLLAPLEGSKPPAKLVRWAFCGGY